MGNQATCTMNVPHTRRCRPSHRGGETIDAPSGGCCRVARLAIAVCNINLSGRQWGCTNINGYGNIQQICSVVNRPTLLSPPGIVRALGGQPLGIFRETEVRVSKAGRINVLVTRSLPRETSLVSGAIAPGKGILECFMVVNGSNWESQLGAAVTAYGNIVSGATNYTPFQALYDRQMRVPLTKALHDGVEGYELEDDSVAAMARIWAGAREALRQIHRVNEAQQKRERLSRELRRELLSGELQVATRSLSLHLE